MLRHIPLGAMRNLRDLGGYPTTTGTATAWERILRGDTPVGLSEADVDWLFDRDITTIIDLRQTEETEHRPNELKFMPGFSYHHCSLVVGGLLPNNEQDVAAGYFRMLDEKNTLCRVMRLIAHAPGGVLFHCTAGKDRTGCVAALLLSLAEVSLPDILADYQISETYIMDWIRQVAARMPDMAAFIGRSKSAYMEGCLRLLAEKYGNVPDYLRAAGLTVEELELLRDKLAD